MKLGLCDKELKKAKAKEYTDGLLTHGGTSTDAFMILRQEYPVYSVNLRGDELPYMNINDVHFNKV